ncbi:MAG: HAD family hydrolase [Phycisphaerales bacterium]
MPGTLPLRQYDLVICDIDGCLSPESSDPFDLPSLAKVAEHNRLAIETGDRPVLTLCSGRPQPFAEAMCRLLANTLVPCICENGVWIYHPGDNRYEMDPRIGKEHLHAVHEASEWVFSEFGPKGVTEQPGKAASVSLYHPDAEYLRREVAPAVEKEFKARGWPLKVTMTWFYINCDLECVNKGTALDRMLGEMRVPRERLAGIGDTVGDKYIAERVKFFACPGNAQAGIKEHAHYIASGHEAKGVVEILERL